MKIIHPTLSVDDFGPLQFAPLEDEPLGPPVFALTVDDSLVGELAPLDTDGGARIMLDEHQECVLDAAGCWKLELADTRGSVTKSHILCVTSHDDVDEHVLTGELAVWATLTMISAKTPNSCPRG
jgi:hypothetical protein